MTCLLNTRSRGACYYDTANTLCETGNALDTATRNKNIEAWAASITAAGVAWLYWEVLPNADPHVRIHRFNSCPHYLIFVSDTKYNNDFEIGVNVDPSWGTLKEAALAASEAPGAFDYTPYLLNSSTSSASSKSVSLVVSSDGSQSSGSSRMMSFSILVFGGTLSLTCILL